MLNQSKELKLNSNLHRDCAKKKKNINTLRKLRNIFAFV